MVKAFKAFLAAISVLVTVLPLKAMPENDPVGKIDDEFTVTPMGQVNYEIPIPALPGTGGIAPKLSVSYSSSTKSALFGYGFDLKGLSVISRVPRNMFNDEVAGCVEFSTNDRYALDGARLIKTSGSGSVWVFSTENDNFSKIVSYGLYENPDSFVVKTKDGLKYLYLPNTKILDANTSEKALYWVLTKVQDTNRNYFTVSYIGENRYHEIYPSRIDYTGNADASLLPYASVRFYYDSTPDTANTYVYGKIVRHSKCVKQIGLFSGETLKRKFEFTYSTVNHKKQLAQMVEYAMNGADSTSLRPTAFEWSNAESLNFTLSCYNQTSLVHKAKLTIGDYNGDGKADFVATPENGDAGWNGWRLFLSTGSNFVNAANGTLSTDEVLEVISGDFTGDGLDDIAFMKRSNNQYATYLLRSTGSGFQAEEFVYISYYRYSIRTVETNGDGVADIFAFFTNSTTYATINSNVVYSVIPLSHTSSGNGPVNWDEVQVGDYNGDGLSDICNSYSDGSRIMYGDGSGTFTIDSHDYDSKLYRKHFGDFNSDGKTDVLETSWNDQLWTYWRCYASSGIGLYHSYQENQEDVRQKQLFVTDVNGDGFDDCIGIDKTNASGNMVVPTVWLNDGTGYHFTPVSGGAAVYPVDRWSFYIGDFTGDGKGDMLCTSQWKSGSNWDGFQLFKMPDTPHLLLSKITDGMGNETEINYKYMSDASVHTRGSTSSYPLTSFSASWPVVYQVKTPNGIGGTNTMTYKYENALLHRNGRGVLGFEKVIVKDETTNTTTTTEYGVEPNKYVIAPVHTQTKIGNRLVSETITEYNTPYSTVFSYHPVSTNQKTYEYTSGNLLSETSTTYTYDNYGNITRAVSTIGNLTSRTVNSYTNDTNNWILGRLTSSTVTKTGPSGTEIRHAQFTYHPQTGLLMSEATEPNNQALGFTKTYQRDVFGNITQSTTTPNSSTVGRTDYTSYDAKGRYITSYTNSLNHTTVNTVDENLGLLMASEDANHVTTSYEYDLFGRQTKVMTPISSTITTMGWSTNQSDAPAYAQYYVLTKTTGTPDRIEFFDCLGRSLRVVTENAFGSKIYVDIVYNGKGQVSKTSQPYFPGSSVQWTQYQYDAAGRVCQQTTPAGAVTTTAYNGYVTTVTDALGHQTTRRTDQYGNLVQSKDHEQGTIDYEYDMNGRCTRLAGPRTSVHMQYDLMGNRTLLDDPDLGQVTSVYNAYGELTSQTDAKGTTTYQYDALGRVTCEQRPDVTISSVYDTLYKGLMTSTSTSAVNSRSYQYDAYGRTIGQTDIINGLSFTTQTTYNALNKVDVLTYPSGVQVKYGYANNGILTSVKNASTNVSYWQLTQQDALGNVTQETFGNGRVTTSTYDAATGYLTGISTPGIQNWTYEYNLIGNLTKRKDNSRNLTETFGYDTLDRLVWVRKNGQLTQQVTYDAAGNILSKTGVGSDFIYQDDTNRLLSYDSDGYSPQDWDTIHYTSFHKISYVRQGNKTLSLTYGPDKARVRAYQTDGQGYTNRYYVGQLYEITYSDAGTRKLCYIFAAGKCVAIHETVGSTSSVRYVHHDHLGSIQAYSDAQGNLAQELSYDAWGRRRNPATWEYYAVIADANAWHERGFGGHEHIDLFEMVNMDGRMYDPVLGRFLSPDPFVQAPDFTQGLNRYIYCLNNPLSLIDPSGYSWLSDNWKTLVASAVGIAVSALTMGSATPVAVFLAGAAGGAAGALAGALLNGANIGQVAKATFTGAVIGGLSSLMNAAAGDGTFIEQLLKHTFSQGWLEGVQGGNMIHGFMIGAVSGIGGSYLHRYHDELGKTGKVIANAVLGGTVSEIGGGKFANGAITGAYGMLFNEFVHNFSVDEESIQLIFQRALEINQEYYGKAEDFYLSLGGKFKELVNSRKYDMSNACAAKLSEALRLAGIEIESAGWKTIKGNKGYYYANAKLMGQYISNHVNVRGLSVGRNHSSIKYGLVYQSGFSNVSGHVDVVFTNKAAGTYYNPKLRGLLFNAKNTIVWKQ